MKKITYLLMTLAAALAVSCQIENPEIATSEDGNPALTPMTFAISAPGTKTALDGVNVEWKITDEISVFSLPYEEGKYTGDKYTNYDFYVFTPDSKGSSVTISGEIVANEWNEYYAVYPSANSDNDNAGDWQERNDFMQINVTSKKESSRTIRHALPEKQSGTGEEMMLIAKYDKVNKCFQFHHQTSLFKFTVPSELAGKLSKITLSSVGNVEVTGWSNTNVATRNTNIFETNYKSDVYMENSAGIPAGTYYFVVLPREYPAGFTISTFDKDGEIYNIKQYTKNVSMIGTGGSSDVKFGGKIVNLGNLSTSKTSVKTTTLASWKANDYDHAKTISPDWSSHNEGSYVTGGKETGVANPEEEGSGAFMRWSCVSGKSYSLLIVSGDGHYAVRYVGLGDAFEYSVPVPASGFPEGAVIRYQTGYGGGEKSSPMYWRIRYSLDNGTNWAFAETGNDQKTLTNGEIINLAPLTKVKDYVSVNASFSLPSDLAAGTTILIRHECADGEKGIDGNVGKGNIRLTPFTDKNGVAQSGPMITMEY